VSQQPPAQPISTLLFALSSMAPAHFSSRQCSTSPLHPIAIFWTEVYGNDTSRDCSDGFG
ncbi:MAG: hypothetical protein ACPHHS_01775, partial [Candidatus Poseidoniaceae archaeon]